jgi:hypothetical protein
MTAALRFSSIKGVANPPLCLLGFIAILLLGPSPIRRIRKMANPVTLTELGTAYVKAYALDYR